MLGSLIPSSRFLVNDVLNQVDWNKARVIVEYGPGVGTMTQEILKRMRPDAVLLALELNEEFVNFLHEEIVDPRFHAVHASASDVRKVLAKPWIVLLPTTSSPAFPTAPCRTRCAAK